MGPDTNTGTRTHASPSEHTLSHQNTHFPFRTHRFPFRTRSFPLRTHTSPSEHTLPNQNTLFPIRTHTFPQERTHTHTPPPQKTHITDGEREFRRRLKRV